MGEPTQRPEQSLNELEREIREERKFTLAEAIGRLAGPGMMKGVSPVTSKQQAETQLEKLLECHLTSPAGALSVVLLRHVRESEVLLRNLEQPLVALMSCVQQILDSEYLLRDLVREADCEWGRVYGERPYFEKPGVQPHKDDPYTESSVRAALSELLQVLSSEQLKGAS